MYGQNNKLMTGGNDQTSPISQRKFLNTVPMFHTYGSTVFTEHQDLLHAIHRLCFVVQTGNISVTNVNESFLQYAGKKRIRVNDGKEWTLPITLAGNELNTLLGITGQDVNISTNGVIDYNTAFPIGKDFGTIGALYIAAADPDNRLSGGEYWTNVGLRVLQTAGVTNGDNNYEVEFYSFDDRAECLKITSGQIVIVEKFQDSGLLVNPDAPDGTISTFQCGFGNGSLTTAEKTLVSATPLQPQTVRPEFAGTGNVWQYFLDIRINGVQIPIDYDVMYDSSAGALKFGTPPPAGSCLEIAYVLNTGFPTFDATRRYARYTTVEYQGKVFQSRPTPPATYVVGVNPLPSNSQWLDVTLEANKNIQPLYWGLTSSEIWKAQNPLHPLFGWNTVVMM